VHSFHAGFKDPNAFLGDNFKRFAGLMVLKDVLISVLDKTKQFGVSYAEVRTQRNRNTLLSIRDGQVEAVTLAHEVGAGIRVLAKGAWGFSTTNSLKREDLMESLKSAAKMAGVAGEGVREPVKLADVNVVEDKV